MSPVDLSVTELASKVAGGELSAEEAARAALERIHSAAGVNAFITVADDAALAAARRIDEKRARGEPLGKLAGVPIAVKDALCTTDAPTTCASRILLRSSGEPPSAERGWRPPYDAAVVERLRGADAVIIGKTNMDEFAMGSSNENSAFGPVENPWDRSRIPGGSSGGSAASVAAGLVPAALGSDTGGSIRQPAGLCGVVGIKPSYGRVSRYGLVAFASSLDQVGPMASDVRGAARVLEVIAGHDERDSTSATAPVGDYEAACSRPVRGLKVGVPDEYFTHGLEPDVAASVRRALSGLEKAGCELRPVSLPHTRYGVATYYLVATAEASSNLARFDGVRFGLRVEPSGGNLEAMYGATRDRGFGKEVKRRIMLGTYALSAGYYDAYYKKAQEVRTLIRRDFSQAFEKVDALATPISPTVAFLQGDKLDDPLTMYLSDVYTLPASLAGIAGISVPCEPAAPKGDRPSLPVGLQLLCPAFAEERLLSLAAAWEAENPHPRAAPRPRAQ